MSDLAAAAALLRSTDARGLLAAAITGGAEEPDGFTTTLTGWQFRPGAEVTAGYEVAYNGPGGRVVEHLFATSADVGPPAATLTAGDLRLAVWRHPSDPLLPGLPAACDPDTVLHWLGLDRPGADLLGPDRPGGTPTTFDLTLLGYRPLRRAVLRATLDRERAVYLKVLRPRRADDLALRQGLIAAAGLTPGLLGRPAPGVLLTPAAPGRPLSVHLAEPARGLPTPADILDLLDRLPPGLASLPRRPAWADRLDFHTATAVDRLPQATGRLHDLSGRLRTVLAAAPLGPVVATHGDFYEANILLGAGGLQLIDLDAAGPGRREDDLACLLAHLSVLPGLSPGHYGAVPGVLEEWAAAFAQVVDAGALAARVSAVVLSLVSGGDGDQAGHRLDLAEEWLRRAEAACRAR